MRTLKISIKVILALGVLWFLTIPSIRLLLMSNDIVELKKINYESYEPQKAIVESIDLLSSDKYPVNYDKDSFKRIYKYHLLNIDSNQKDTVLETVKKSSYFFEQLKPLYKINDTIRYYKSSNNQLNNLSETEYNFNSRAKEKNPIKWFSLVILVSSISLIIILLKQLFNKL